MSEFIRQHAVLINYQLGESWTILSEIEQSIKKKVEAVGTPLKDWNISINYGIKTGLNEAFIISQQKRDELINEDPKSAEIIRPILRGRDIKKYQVNFSDLYLIALFPAKHYDINDYPSVKDWLINGEWVQSKTKGNPPTPIGSGKLRLEQSGKIHTFKGIRFKSRKKTKNQWFETQDSIQYWDDLNKQKILYSEIVKSPQFFLDAEGEYFPEATTFLVTGELLEVLINYLNSSTVAWIFKKFYAGGGLGEGFRYKKKFIKNLPIPKALMITSKDTELNIMKNYGFSEEQIHYIKDSI